MLRVAITCALAILLSGPISRAIAEFKNEDLQRGIKATALVELPNRTGFGSAFCINSDGYFITNRHIVSGIGVGGKLNIVLSPGGAKDVPIEAFVVGIDDKNDLALLKAPKAAGTPALELGDSAKLHETMSITAFGYPFGNLLAVEKQKYPNISVNVGRVTALRGDRTAPSYIQTDAQLNPGNSGGPMLDESGRVIGVVVAGVQNSGIALVIPASKVKSLLNQPQVDFDAIQVPYAARFKPLDLKVVARPIIPGGPEVESVNVHIDRDGDTVDVPAARGADGHFQASISPLEKPSGPPRYQVELEYRDGSIRGLVLDRTIKIGDQSLKISELQSFARVEPGVEATKSDGKSIKGPLREPASLSLRVAGRDIEVGLDTARHANIMPPVAEPTNVTVTVTAKTQDGQLISKQQPLSIVEPPAPIARSKARPPKEKKTTSAKAPEPHPKSVLIPKAREPLAVAPPPQLGETPIEIELPEKFNQLTCGGGGRYLVFHLPRKKSLAVLDVSAGQIVKELPVASDQILFAAGRKKLMVVLPGARLIQRWDLDTLNRERMVSVPGAKTPLRVVMGSDSDGPLWLWPGGAIEAFDVARMQSQKIDGPVLGSDPQYDFRMLLSADGSTGTGWENGLSSPPYALMHIVGAKATRSDSPFGEGYNGRWMWPNADGSLIFGHGARVFDHNFQKIAADWLEGGSIVPTIDRRYFLLVKPEGKDKSNVSICTSNDRRIVYTLTRIENVTQDSHLEWGRAYGEPRVFYIPSASTLVTIPIGEKEVVLHRLDLAQELKSQGVDYLYADSFAPVVARRGQPWRYQITAHSSGGGKLTYHLESGPQGMSVGPDGLVVWSIPARHKDEQVSAIVSIRDDSANEALHTISFNLADR